MPPKGRKQNDDELNATERKKRALVDWFRSRKTYQTMTVMEISVQNDWNAAKELRPGAKFKEFVKELIDEGKLQSKKCGAQTIVYLFPSTEVSNLVDKATADAKAIDQGKAQLQALAAHYTKLTEDRDQQNPRQVDQSELLDQLYTLRQRNMDLDRTINQYSENDPLLVEELKWRTFLSYHAVNIITRNIGLLTRFFTRQFKNPPYPGPNDRTMPALVDDAPTMSDLDTSTNTPQPFNFTPSTTMSDYGSPAHHHHHHDQQQLQQHPTAAEALYPVSPQEFLLQFGIDMHSFDFLRVPYQLQIEIAQFLLANHPTDLTQADIALLCSVSNTPIESLCLTPTRITTSTTPPQFPLDPKQLNQLPSATNPPLLPGVPQASQVPAVQSPHIMLPTPQPPSSIQPPAPAVKRRVVIVRKKAQDAPPTAAP